MAPGGRCRHQSAVARRRPGRRAGPRGRRRDADRRRHPVVPSGMAANAVVVATDDGLWLADLTGVQRTPVVTTTHALAADIAFDYTPLQRLGGDADWLRDVARVGLAAGSARQHRRGRPRSGGVPDTAEQFGRPLATFQAVSQQLGDGYCDVQAMRATLWQAVWALERVAEEGTLPAARSTSRRGGRATPACACRPWSSTCTAGWVPTRRIPCTAGCCGRCAPTPCSAAPPARLAPPRLPELV